MCVFNKIIQHICTNQKIKFAYFPASPHPILCVFIYLFFNASLFSSFSFSSHKMVPGCDMKEGAVKPYPHHQTVQ